MRLDLPRLHPKTLFHSFADGSGTVFFDPDTGETLALEWNAATLQAVLSGRSDIKLDLQTLSKLRAFGSWPDSMRLDEQHDDN